MVRSTNQNRGRPLLSYVTGVTLVLLVLAGLLLALQQEQLRFRSRSPTAASGRRQQALGASIRPALIGLLPNACLRFLPTNDNRERTVFIDPGHGSPDSGTEGKTSAGATVLEKDLTLATALKLRDLLREEGYTVVMARVGDSSVAEPTAADRSGGAMTAEGIHRDVQARVSCANALQSQLLLSIHFNALAGNASVSGTETFYDDVRPFSDQNARFARLVQSSVLAKLAAAGWQVRDRGVAPDSALVSPTLTEEAAAYPHLLELGPAKPGWFDEPSRMPGVLVEPLFLTNPAEADIAASARGQDAIAMGLQAAIDAFWGPARTPIAIATPSATVPPSTATPPSDSPSPAATEVPAPAETPTTETGDAPTP